MTTAQKIVWIAYALLVAACSVVMAFGSVRLGEVRTAIAFGAGGAGIATILHAVLRPRASAASPSGEPSKPRTP